MEVVLKKDIGLEELHLYISLLKDHKIITHTTPPKKISNLIEQNFGAGVSEEAIRRYFEPTAEEEELDMVLAYRNLGYEL